MEDVTVTAGFRRSPRNGTTANRGFWFAAMFFIVFVLRSFYLIAIRRCVPPIKRVDL
jgi:hypothetical protein